MPSKFETRIATQRYHGISSRDWFRLTDQEQAALIAEARIAEQEREFSQKRKEIRAAALLQMAENQKRRI